MIMSNEFPVHPLTGLRAIGFRRNGAPIWPVMGGAPEDDTRDDQPGQRNDGPTLTHSQAVNRLHDIRSELTRLDGLDTMSPEDESYFRELTEEFDTVDEHRKRLERRHRLARIEKADDAVESDLRNMRILPGSTRDSDSRSYESDPFLHPDSVKDKRFKNPWDLRDVRTYGREPGQLSEEYKARALSCIEQMPAASADIRSAATKIIERFDDKAGTLSRQCIITSQPAYMRAFAKLATNKPHSLTAEEQRAIAEVEEFRAMSLTDSAGGYLVPFQLDPTVIVTSAGLRSDIRQVARTVVAIGDTWNGVSSANVSWSFDPEGTEVSDDSPAFAQPSIPNYMARGFVPISIEALQDEQNVAAAVGELLAGGKDDLEANKFILGSGSGEPTGIITALLAASPTVTVNSTTTDTFAIGDIYKLQGSLPARYRSNAVWLANNLVYSLIRQFDQYGGGGFWTNLTGGRPPELMGYPAIEAEAVDGVINATQENYIAVFGDFRNFVITDRIGMAVEFIPHLVGANRRPTGQRGWFAYYRTGSDSVNDGAFRLLDVT
jgi:HK97 family phage major capsid protein